MSLSSITIKLDFSAENGAISSVSQIGNLPTPFTENVNEGALGSGSPPVPSELYVNYADTMGVPGPMDSAYANNANMNPVPFPISFSVSENAIPSPLMNVSESYYDSSSVPTPSLSMLANITNDSAIPEPEDLDDPSKKNRVKLQEKEEDPPTT